jgi:TonB family protein
MKSCRLLAFFVFAVLAARAVAGFVVAREPRKDAQSEGLKDRTPSRIRVGGDAAQANLVHQVMPIYPGEAKDRNIEGIVVLRVVIDKSGTVADLRFESGPAELKAAAMEAVKQWRYSPCVWNGQAAEADTELAILFTMKGEDYKAIADSRVPIAATVSATTMKLPPPKHPSASRAGKAPFPDTLDGIKVQTEEVLDAFRAGDRKKAEELLDGFAMADPAAWLTQTFGPETGAALGPDYEIGFEKFKAHMARVGKAWTRSPNAALRVEYSDVPKPPEEAGKPEGPPKPTSPLRIENFRFFVTTGQVDPGNWVLSFVYLDGAFRGVGGTRTFWNETWRLKHDEVALWTGDVQWQLAYADKSVIEGVASERPDDGLVRVFVAARVQATRLKERVEPVYPATALKAGVEGTVLFHAIIAKDGSIEELTLEDGDPVLAKAAEEAVRKWRYEPITYQDRPTEIDTAIAVQFKLPKDSASPPTVHTDTPESPDAAAAHVLYDSGMKAFYRGDYRSAAELLESSVARYPHKSGAFNDLGRTYLFLDQVDKAVIAFQKAVEINPSDRFAYNNLGRAFWKQKKYDQAVEAFTKQLEINPQDRFVHPNLGLMYMQMNKYDKAATEFEIAAAAAPGDPSIQASLGRAYAMLKQTDKAVAALERAVEIAPVASIQNTASYEMSLMKINLTRAEALADLAISATAAKTKEISLNHVTMDDVSRVCSLAAYWDTMGWVKFQQGDLPRAHKYVGAAWELCNFPAIGDHLGQIYEKEGRESDAIHQYQLTLATHVPMPDTRTRLAGLVGDETKIDAMVSEAKPESFSRPTIKLKNLHHVRGDADFWVLLAPGPTVAAVQFIVGDDRLQSLSDQIRSSVFPDTFPDSMDVKLLRRTHVTCSHSRKDCTLVVLSADSVHSTN